jgi:4-alpha-glucanotransferase
MNILGTHDTERIITRLASDLGECEPIDLMSNDEKAALKLSDKAYERAKQILKMASTLQFTVYGVPSIYYGDEAGLDGAGDPFCRRTYPWGREDEELLSHYRRLGEIRRQEKTLALGDFRAFMIGERAIGFERRLDGETLLVLASRESAPVTVALDGEYTDLMSGGICKSGVIVMPDTAVILKRK